MTSTKSDKVLDFFFFLSKGADVMPQKQDKRVCHTIHALQTALIQLLQEKNINRISVRELCERAGVNRSTFYVYYKCIDELMEEIEQDVYAHLERIFQNENSGLIQIQRMMEFVRENRVLVQVVLQHSISGAMMHFSSIMQQRFISKRRYAGGRDDLPEARYLYELLFTGTLGVIQKWMENDCGEDPAKMAQIVWNTVLFCENQKNFGNPIAF